MHRNLYINTRTSWHRWAGEVKAVLRDRGGDPCHYTTSVQLLRMPCWMHHAPLKTEVSDSILNRPSISKIFNRVINKFCQSYTCVNDDWCSNARTKYLCSWSGPPWSMRVAGVSLSYLREKPDVMSLLWILFLVLDWDLPALDEAPCNEAPAAVESWDDNNGYLQFSYSHAQAC